MPVPGGTQAPSTIRAEPPVLTAAALPGPPPLRGRLRPAAPAPRQVLATSLGESAHLGPVIDARGAQSVKSARVGVAGEETAVGCRRGPAEDVRDAVGGASSQLGTQSGGSQLVEGTLH